MENRNNEKNTNKKKKKSVVGKVILIIVIILVILLGMGAGIGFWYVQDKLGKVNYVDIASDDIEVTEGID